jgi:hypothetical protein
MVSEPFGIAVMDLLQSLHHRPSKVSSATTDILFCSDQFERFVHEWHISLSRGVSSQFLSLLDGRGSRLEIFRSRLVAL